MHGNGAGRLRVAIIGAGIAGLGMGIELKRRGIDSFTIYEKAGKIGGTWRDNTYPGASCDIPSHLYSYSFAPYRSNVTRYPRQPEVLAYLNGCADDFGLRRHLCLDTEIVAARYDEHRGQWDLTAAGGREYEADVVISAVGQLNLPRYPSIAGRENFSGTSYHSARWNHGHDLTDRTVAVIGTGSSGAQIIPGIVDQVRKLYVVQRSANWVMPKPGAQFHPVLRTALRWFPFLHRAYRSMNSRRSEAVLFPSIRRGWSSRILTFMAGQHLKKQVQSAPLRKKLRPDFAIGCKRIVLASDYFPALTRENVEVVTEPVVEITESGIRTEDGVEREVDTLIYATGFRTTEFLAPMTVTGIDGKDLRDTWKNGASAYLGIHVPDFPNLFLMYGPNTNLGHNSVVLMLEAQSKYVVQCVELLTREASSAALDVRPGVMAAWHSHLDEGIRRTVWTGGCSSWFKTEEGRVTNNWPYPTKLYQKMTHRPDLAALRLIELDETENRDAGPGPNQASTR